MDVKPYSGNKLRFQMSPAAREEQTFYHVILQDTHTRIFHATVFGREYK